MRVVEKEGVFPGGGGDGASSGERGGVPRGGGVPVGSSKIIVRGEVI